MPIGLAAVPLVLSRIEESFGGDTGLDLPGLALVSAAAFGIVWGLVRGNTAGWASLEVLGALAAGLLLVGAFIARELRAPEPMLPVRFFRSRAFSAGNAAIFFTMASLFGAVFFFAQMLQTAPRLRAPGRRAAVDALDRSPSSRWLRSSAPWWTASESAPSWSAGCPCKQSEWAGSP